MTDMEQMTSSGKSHVYSSGREINGDPPKTNENDPRQQDKAPSPHPIRRVLLVDDERLLCEVFKRALEEHGYAVAVALNGNEGLELFRKGPADLIITDIFMPEKDGHTFISDILQEFPGTHIIAVTGYQTGFGMEIELEVAKALGAERVFAKPFKIRDILQAIKDIDTA